MNNLDSHVVLHTHVLPYTFPARPVNGGPLEKALPKSGDWCYEPKYNGWRALVHVPTGTMFNRKGERLSIAHEFKSALDHLRQRWEERIYPPKTEMEWLDCEAMERRHNIGRGSLIVLDFLWSKRETYAYRRVALEMSGFQIHTQLNQPVPDNSVYLVASYPGTGADRSLFETERKHLQLWDILQQCNQALGCHFYEGLVAKRADSHYPVQLRSADLEFPFWMKHRWAF